MFLASVVLCCGMAAGCEVFGSKSFRFCCCVRVSAHVMRSVRKFLGGINMFHPQQNERMSCPRKTNPTNQSLEKPVQQGAGGIEEDKRGNGPGAVESHAT